MYGNAVRSASAIAVIATLGIGLDARAAQVVTSLDDSATPAPGSVTLRAALAAAASGETISFAPALDGQTILLGIVGEEHSTLKGEVYAPTFLGYQERDYGPSALYARKDVVIDASALPSGITIKWNGGDASRARVLAVYGNLTMKNVTVASGYSVAVPLPGNTAQPYTLARGGGLAVWGTATLERCAIVNNTIVGDNDASRDRGSYGGGIYANGLDLRDCVVGGNAAIGYGAAGGGIYSVGGADSTTGFGSDATVERCSVSGNLVRAQHAYGGGIFTLSGGPNNLATMYVVNSTVATNLVEDNPALPDVGQYYYRGGGIYMGGGSLVVIASTIAENSVNGAVAIFSGKPNVGGGGVAATVGNAHVVEDVIVQHSIAVGNHLNGAPEDWFAGSLLAFRSYGYNLIGTLDFSQILVPIPDYLYLNRKFWPRVGDVEGVATGDVIAAAAARRHASALSVGTDAGAGVVLWYPPVGPALDAIPAGSYELDFVDVGYQPYGAAADGNDDFLNQVLLRVERDHADVLGAGFRDAFVQQYGDPTGVTFYPYTRTWPSLPENASWIAFWRNLDTAIGGRLGMATLGDAFWRTFAPGVVGNQTLSTETSIVTVVPRSNDQLGGARPRNGLLDVGAVESVPPATGATLIASRASPQPLGTAVRFDAQGLGSPGPFEYRFWLCRNGAWEVVRDYAASPSWTLPSTTPAGAYQVAVHVRTSPAVFVDAQAVAPFVVGDPVTRTPASGATLTPDVSSPRPVGTAVRFDAQGQGSTDPYEYRFWMFRDGAWQVVQDYGAASSWTMPSDTPAGTYQVAVHVRTDPMRFLDVQAVTTFVIGDPVTPATGVSLTPNVAGPQPVGTAVRFDAQGEGSPNPYEYRFWLFRDGAWQVVQDYGGGASWTMPSDLPAGQYLVSVHVRTSTGVFVDADAVVPYVIGQASPPTAPATGVTLTPNLTSPRAAGTPVRFDAEGQGGSGTYEYRFWLYRNGAWEVVQDYGVGSSWIASLPAGSYDVAVHVRTDPLEFADVQAVVPYVFF